MSATAKQSGLQSSLHRVKYMEQNCKAEFIHFPHKLQAGVRAISQAREKQEGT